MNGAILLLLILATAASLTSVLREWEAWLFRKES